jgi:hypothetical protein
VVCYGSLLPSMFHPNNPLLHLADAPNGVSEAS